MAGLDPALHEAVQRPKSCVSARHAALTYGCAGQGPRMTAERVVQAQLVAVSATLSTAIGLLGVLTLESPNAPMGPREVWEDNKNASSCQDDVRRRRCAA